MSDVEIVLRGHARDLGGFQVVRVLPALARRSLGPVVFFDHLGPLTLPPGQGIDVRPHPHIGLATVTYLFEGELVHRDSLGTHQRIQPGAVNWMTAGRGIVHSERSGREARAEGVRAHGLQLWVGLPRAHEETAPDFQHHPAPTLPELQLPGAQLRVMVGTAFGQTSPVRVLSPFCYVDIALEAGAELELPAATSELPERAAYVVSGELSVDGSAHPEHRLVVFTPGSRPVVRATAATRLVWLAGQPLDGPRHIVWNFVSSSRERLEQAALDWSEDRFPTVPGDEHERIPLPT